MLLCGDLYLLSGALRKGGGVPSLARAGEEAVHV